MKLAIDSSGKEHSASSITSASWTNRAITRTQKINLLDVRRRDTGRAVGQQVFDICENIGGGDCLFMALWEATLEGIPWHASHVDIRMAVVDFTLKNWEQFNEQLKNQHKAEIPCFCDEGVDEETLKTAYENTMRKPRTFATTEELQIASILFNFSFTILQSNWTLEQPTLFSKKKVKRESYQIFNFENLEKPIRWLYLRFSGDMNAGHWEYLRPIFLPPGVTSLAQGPYTELNHKTGFDRTDMHMTCYVNQKTRGDLSILPPLPPPFPVSKGTLGDWFGQEMEEEGVLEEVYQILTQDVSHLNQENETIDQNCREINQADSKRTLRSMSKATLKRKAVEECLESEEVPKIRIKDIVVTEQEKRTPIYGKKILVAGGVKGLGREIVRKLHRERAEVHVIDNEATSLKELIYEYPYVQPHFINDVFSWEETERIIFSISPLDGLVNVTGMSIPTPFLKLTPQLIISQFQVNFVWLVNTMQAFAKGIVQSKTTNGGSIVNISSIFDETVLPYSSIFSSTQSALSSIGASVAAELEKVNIRVNTVRPLSLPMGMEERDKSNVVEDVWEHLQKVFNSEILPQKMSDEDLVNWVLFLLSDASGGTTGSKITIKDVNSGY